MNDSEQKNGEKKRMELANVIAVFRDRYELKDNNNVFYARLKTSEFYNTDEIIDFPTVGDNVEIIKNDIGDSLITKVCDRKSVFKRMNSTSGLPDQAVAANFDYVFIVMSLNHDFHLTKVERYINVAWQSGGTPVVILTKADLCEDRQEYVSKVMECAPGVDVHCISSYTGEGIVELEKYFSKGKVVVLLGSSGVGKSSLTNTLLGTDEMLTGGIREADSQGRHTTTYKQCFVIPEKVTLPNGEVINGGGSIIDTPGMRKVLMGTFDEAVGDSEISNPYEDIEALASQCRFNDCTHKSEPGCAVKAALEDGTLSERRWKTYLSMLKEEAYAKSRREHLERKMTKRKR